MTDYVLEAAYHLLVFVSLFCSVGGKLNAAFTVLMKWNFSANEFVNLTKCEGKRAFLHFTVMDKYLDGLRSMRLYRQANTLPTTSGSHQFTLVYFYFLISITQIFN